VDALLAGSRPPRAVDGLLLAGQLGRRQAALQGFRESLGGALAFEAFTQAVDIPGRGCTCVLRNDAAAAIASFSKGSTRSPQTQRCALRLDRVAALIDVDCFPYHVPGLTLVAEGINGASCGGVDFGEDANVDSILCPAVSDDLWLLVARCCC
jgi:hypothetical protein